jgi:hypothetical protein
LISYGSLTNALPETAIRRAQANLTSKMEGRMEKDENLFCPAKILEKPRNLRKNL